MKRHLATKLKEAEDTLGQAFPELLSAFISSLNKAKVTFRDEDWFFESVKDKPKDPTDNYIIRSSVNFREEWGLEGLVFATNGIGDDLVVLPDEFGETILVMMHETAELKLFGKNIQEVSENGPVDYFSSDNYCYKLDENNQLIESEDFNPNVTYDPYSEDYFGEDYERRSQLDNWIDDQETKKTAEILDGLKKLSNSNDDGHKVWALNKLSDVYFKGFGAIPRDLPKALEYNQKAIDLNSHKALSNRSACYFYGIGMTKDVVKALELAIRANELSRANQFANILATKKGGGLYDTLVDIITGEMNKKEDMGFE
jgi:tetratricopeptide (TPR) repeat protein